MQTFEQCYHEIAIDNTRWSYYSNPIQAIDKVWLKSDDAYNFIHNYFNYAGKNKVFEDVNIKKNIEFLKPRTSHIISTFLLGIKIAECFDIDLGLRDECNMNFKYYWFLSCLYHDIGYVYESKHKCRQLKMISMEGIEALQEICGIHYIHDRVFKTYPKEVVDFYLKCRADCHKSQPKIDHGIVGGLLLYDKLRKQFSKAWTNRNEKSDSRDDFYVMHEDSRRLLHLSNNHFDAYAKAADAIITHNIWKNTLKQYIKDYGTPGGFSYIDFDKPISIDNKICFILSLADTIEPLKRGMQYLMAISVEQIENQKGIKLQMDKKTYNNVYNGNLKSLEDWVDVLVNIE
jgi:hypothetical protein